MLDHRPLTSYSLEWDDCPTVQLLFLGDPDAPPSTPVPDRSYSRRESDARVPVAEPIAVVCIQSAVRCWRARERVERERMMLHLRRVMAAAERRSALAVQRGWRRLREQRRKGVRGGGGSEMEQRSPAAPSPQQLARAEAARAEVARAEAAREEAAALEASMLEEARQQLALAEALKAETLQSEAATAEAAARVEAARQERARADAAREEAARVQAELVEAARAEEARTQALRLETAEISATIAAQQAETARKRAATAAAEEAVTARVAQAAGARVVDETLAAAVTTAEKSAVAGEENPALTPWDLKPDPTPLRPKPAAASAGVAIVTVVEHPVPALASPTLPGGGQTAEVAGAADMRPQLPTERAAQLERRQSFTRPPAAAPAVAPAAVPLPMSEPEPLEVTAVKRRSVQAAAVARCVPGSPSSPFHQESEIGILHKETGAHSASRLRVVSWKLRYVSTTTFSLRYRHLDTRGKPVEKFTDVAFGGMVHVGIQEEDPCILIVECYERRYLFRFLQASACEAWAAKLSEVSTAVRGTVSRCGIPI